MNRNKKAGYYQLTYEGDYFSNVVAKEINSDYPSCAIVENGICYVPNDYWERSKRYVQKFCNCNLVIKPYKKRKPAQIGKCIYCGLECSIRIIKQHHNENCRFKNKI